MPGTRWTCRRTPEQLDTAADAVICLVNAERTSRGPKALKRDVDLAQAARGHSRDMARNRYFDHGPTATRSATASAQAGYGNPGDGWKVGEDLGWGTGEQATPAWLVDAWLNSPPHQQDPAHRRLPRARRRRRAGAPKAIDRSPARPTRWTSASSAKTQRMTASAPRYGVTSMVAPLQRVLVRKPATSGDWDDAGWRTPDAAALERQHAQFVELLDGLGVEVELADALDGQVDSVYMHDPLIMSGTGGIPLNMAKPARQKEPGHAKAGVRAPRHPRPRHARGRRLRRRRRPLLARRHDRGDRPRLPHQPQGRAGPAGAAEPRGHPRRDLRHAARPGPGLRPAPAVVPVARRPTTCSSSSSRSRPSACCRTSRSAASTGSRSTRRATTRWAATSSPSGPAWSSWSTARRRCARRSRHKGVEVHVYDGTDLTLKGDGGPTCLTARCCEA